MNTEQKEKVLNTIISCQFGCYTALYAPDRAVVSTLNIAELAGMTKYEARKAVKALEADGLIERTSQGRPAIVSYGEYTELVSEAAPPTNGFALTQKGFACDAYKKAEKEFEEAMRRITEKQRQKEAEERAYWDKYFADKRAQREAEEASKAEQDGKVD